VIVGAPVSHAEADERIARLCDIAAGTCCVDHHPYVGDGSFRMPGFRPRPPAMLM
jgi:hypothetical protein